jgi:hypothetical protein
MKPTRFQVDIKPNHQPVVKQLMQMLGNVSSADAIGFLIETQMSAALARLHPGFNLPQFATEETQFATEKTQVVTRFPNLQQEAPQDDTNHRQPATVSHGMPQAVSHSVQRADHSLPQNMAADALDALLGA